jgi:hypothetical protein
MLLTVLVLRCTLSASSLAWLCAADELALLLSALGATYSKTKGLTTAPVVSMHTLFPGLQSRRGS